MMTSELLIAYIAFAFTASMSPGPNNLMLLASGTNHGFFKTVPHMVGITLGFVVLILLVGVGLIKLFEFFPFLLILLKGGSCVYLLYLAWKIARSGEVQQEGVGSSRPMTFLEAALFQWVNPKAWAMALTTISVYLPSSGLFGDLFLLLVIFGLITSITVVSWAGLGTQIRRVLTNPLRLQVFNYTAAILLVGTLIPILMSEL